MRFTHLRSEKKVNEFAYSNYLKTLAPISQNKNKTEGEPHIVEAHADRAYINEFSYLQAAQLYYMQSSPSVIQFSATYFR